MKFYENHREMNQLWHVEDLLADEFNRDLDRARDNQYVVRMDEQTVSKWESVFDVVQSEGESLGFRRERILNRLTNKPPFNMRFITDKINLLMGNNYYIIYFNRNSLTIILEGTIDSPERLKEIYLTVMAIKPANVNYLYSAMSKQVLSNNLYNYVYGSTQESNLLLSPDEVISW